VLQRPLDDPTADFTQQVRQLKLEFVHRQGTRFSPTEIADASDDLHDDRQ
jgi:hypothetical protein